MRRAITYWLLFWTTFTCFSPANLFAAEEPYSNSLKGAIKKGDTLWVKDEKFKSIHYEWNRIQQQEVTNFVTLRFSNDSMKKAPAKFYVELSLNIEYYTSPEQPQPLEKKNVKLRIEYNADSSHLRKLIDYYQFSDAHWMRIEVEEMKSDVFPDIAQYVELQAQVLVDRKYKVDETRHSTPSIRLISESEASVNPAFNSKTMQTSAMRAVVQSTSPSSTVLQVSIPQEEVGEEFDVEWTPLERTATNTGWVDQLLSNNVAAKPDLIKHFWNNGSRQTLRSTRTARITLAYREQYLCVRTRSVSYSVDGIRIEGEWDYEVTENGANRLAIFELYATDPIVDQSFESKLNWQYTGSFSDDGRKKEVVNYFDGALRSRQMLTQTYEGEEPTTIVGESILDPVGRNVVNFLPVPISNSTLAYKKNVYGNDLRFGGAFLTAGTTLLRPIFNPLPVNTNNPASTYYTPQNHWIADGNNGFIPNADGFPFTVTGYTADQSGLVRFQGGLGSTFQPINSHQNNRTTRFYYSKPTQAELNMMFGNEIGFAEHYQKIASVDPNGQISLAWKNLAGKTIATAITGAVPSNLGVLSGAIEINTQTLLIKPSDFIVDRANRTLTGIATHFVASSGNGKLSLDFEQLVNQYTNGSVEVCSGCQYNVSVKVIDEYGAAVKDLISNSDKETFQLVTENGNCSVSGTINKEFNYSFPGIGEYTFQVVLSITNEAVDNQTAYYITQREAANDLLSRSHFLETEIQSLNLDDCYADCSTCIVELGVKQDFVAAMIQNIENSFEQGHLSATDITSITQKLNDKYDALLASCTAKQAGCVNDVCSAYSTLMLMDVSPGGQYALYNAADANLPLLETHINVLSRFFRTVFPIRSSTHADYKETAFSRNDGTMTSPHDANFTTKDLIVYWQEDWAQKFLPYHPEYCKLLFCQNNNQYYVWDKQIAEEILSLDQLSQHRYTTGHTFSNNTPNWLLTKDPFFAAGKPGAGKYSTMANLLSNYSTQVQGIGASPVKNINQVIDFMLYCSTPGATTALGDPQWSSCQVVESCRVPNEEWRMFVEFYFVAKQKIYEQLQAEAGCAGSCQVGRPISISFSGCPSVVQVLVKADPSASCGAGKKVVSVILPGKSNGSTTLKIKYPVAFSSGLPATLVFSNGQQNGQLCVPVGLPVEAIVIDEVLCSPPTLPENNCPFGNGGTLNLASTAKREADDRFSSINTTNGDKTTYIILKGRADQTPSTAGYCTGTVQGTPVFYACYAVKIGVNQVALYNDVWVFSCLENLCASAPVLNMELMLGTNKYTAGGYVYYVQPNGATTPNPECSNALLLYSQTCVKVKVGTGAETSFVNANVYRCEACNVGSASISVNSQTSSNPLTFSASNGTYYVYPNVSSSQSITPPSCSGGMTNSWTNCLTVSTSSGSTTYNNARYFFCPTASCPYVTDFYVSSQTSYNEFIEVQSYGCSHYINRYTIYTGYTSSNQPPYSSCSNNGIADFVWYNCLQLYNTQMAQTIRYTNVWVKICSEYVYDCYGTYSASTIEQPASTQDLQKSMISSKSRSYNEFKKKAEKGVNYRVVRNNYDGTTNIIRRVDKSSLKKKGIDSIPGFSPFVFKSSYYVPTDSVVGEQFNNVEVATMLASPQMQTTSTTATSCLPGSSTFPGGSFNISGGYCSSSTQYEIAYSVTLTSPAPTDIVFTILVNLQTEHGNQPLSITDHIPMGQSSLIVPNCSGLIVGPNPTVLSACITISVPPPGPSCAPELAYKTSRFPTVSLPAFVNTGQVMAQQMALVKEGIGSACEGNADALLSRIRPFLLSNISLGGGALESHATYIRLRNRLIDVCNAGGDFDHPMGASTTRPGTNANVFTSFQAVLEAEFPLALDYNPWLLGGPLPWGVQQQVFASTITRTNADICNKLAVEQAAATLAGKTLLQHLIDKYGASTVTITAEELEELQEGCTNCRFLLDEPITLPVFLDAKSDGCISRTSFNTAKASFVNLFGSSITNPNYTEVYKNYMNGTFGMVLTYADYLAFDAGTGEYLCNEVVDDPIAGDPYGCANEMMGVAIINAKRAYEDYIAEIKRDFQQKYVSTCMATQSKIGFQKAESYNAITLYYYDNAGNLLKTITPKDFRRVNENLWANVDLIRNGAPITPSLQPSFAPHMAATSYYYNSLNGVTAQYTPDADLSNFWYDTKGRLFASQNKEQHSPTTVDGVTLPADRYSYTQYDALGRIIVVGEQSGKTLTTVLNNSFVQDADITSFFNGGPKKSVTRTFYDNETTVAGHPWYNAGLQSNLHNLRKRVVASTYQETENGTIDQATYYSYDLIGNVKSVWQRLVGLPEFKRTDYQFELTSGKTTGVLYQDGKSDAFYHQYEYDAENRVKAVYTNTQKTTSAGLLSLVNAPGTVKDANYQYYPHGPLSRTELGGNLQGLDYAYTLQGWLKTLNGQDLNASKDMGRDGESGTGLHAGFSRDVLAYTIGYFIGDYSPINGSNFIRPFSHNGVSGLRGVSQYNGNISHATYANKGLGDGTNIVGYLYTYRQLNVLAGRNFHTISSSLNSWHDNTGTTQKYRESYNTDVNGNITTIIRNGDQPNDSYKMDDLRLEYNGNKLDYVRELYANSAAYANDMENQAAGNYTYDKIGNLIKDVDAGLTGVYWNVYGKITEIRKGSTVMKYRYDASGNRVYKETVASGVTNSTWYVRDAQGNVLTTYDASGGTPLVKESYIYGSSRLGLYRWIPGAAGKRSYEISNYLGNVMATIGDNQMAVGSGSLIDYYDADIETATDYYSYGMVMPNRESNVEGYRYGFNGKENDNEVKGLANQQDYGLRIYDTRLGRFLSVDPLTDSYPWNSPFSYAEGDPINYIDIDGAETGSSRAQTTVRPTLPQLSNLSVGKDGALRNSTQLFTSGQVNSGTYSPQTRRVTQAELDALIPPGAGAYINSDGESMTVYNSHGSWQVSLLKAVHKAKSPEQMDWVERGVLRLRAEYNKQFNTLTQWNVSIQAYEVVTSDPSSLTDEYLDDVNRRLINGTATDRDKLYANEVALRKAAGIINDPDKVSFIQGRGDKAIKKTVDLPNGYKKTGFKSHNQAVYYNGTNWITPDQDGHNGGVWKMFDKEKNIGSTDKSKRVGTYDANLNRVGD